MTAIIINPKYRFCRHFLPKETRDKMDKFPSLVDYKYFYQLSYNEMKPSEMKTSWLIVRWCIYGDSDLNPKGKDIEILDAGLFETLNSNLN